MAEQVSSFDEIYRAYLNLSEVIGTDAGQLHEGLSVIRRGLERVRELGLELALPGNILRSNWAWWLWFLGRWQEAEVLATETLGGVRSLV